MNKHVKTNTLERAAAKDTIGLDNLQVKPANNDETRKSIIWTWISLSVELSTPRFEPFSYQ